MASLSDLRAKVRAFTYADEDDVVRHVLSRIDFDRETRLAVRDRTVRFVNAARERKDERGVLDAFMQQFGLSTNEGIALLSLAEALLRVPDAQTADDLIAEKIAMGAWKAHAGQSDSVWVNAATRALMLGQEVVDSEHEDWLGGLVSRLGAPVVRTAVRQAMRVMGGQFVTGETIEAALEEIGRSKALASFDMLGEGARTARDAERHFNAYLEAIRAVAKTTTEDMRFGHGVSIKLSALHPRYDYMNVDRVRSELFPRVRTLACAARDGGMHLTIDAEEAARLDLSLEIIEMLAREPDLASWPGLGLAVQCYSKRALPLLEWVVELGRETRRRFMVRLVKGAYWDTEIKRAQEMGLPGYPVFTRKITTDVSYLACAAHALGHRDAIYPQFATHNAHTIAAVLEMAGDYREFEFQRLHGMGELLYEAIVEEVPDLPPVRVYAPVGTHTDLLAYLVRRLLENGANTSFINQYLSPEVSPDSLAQDPIERLRSMNSAAHPKIPLPKDIYGPTRRNSRGYDLADPRDARRLLDAIEHRRTKEWEAIRAHGGRGAAAEIRNPANRNELVGRVFESTTEEADEAVGSALAAHAEWDALGGEHRARILEQIADALEEEHEQALALIVREAGRTLNDALAEIREAVDFCRYYAAQARADFGAGRRLPGPTGESNVYSLHGRGVFVCISPWNFPLAIFTGQVAAALAAGNSVIAKPAEQTPLVGAFAVNLMHRCGVPQDVLSLVPGRGETVGARLVADERIAGVAMTGSTATAKLIARTLAARQGPIVPLIAETGGQNAMFVDSTALPEQVVDDVLRSAFHSAGQRCSALRVIFIQEDVAERIIDMIVGAMDELRIGDPARLETDLGPVIDEEARTNLQRHIDEMTSRKRLLHAVKLDPSLASGTFVAPHLFEIRDIGELHAEHFGPLLHVVRYRAEDLDRHLQALRDTGYGLTLGVHSRIHAQAHRIFEASSAGNVYVNRNMIGAVVGVQPFGGHGLSGTGPKAGGPLYLHRFAAERVLTINTAATGGNAALLSLSD